MPRSPFVGSVTSLLCLANHQVYHPLLTGPPTLPIPLQPPAASPCSLLAQVVPAQQPQLLQGPPSLVPPALPLQPQHPQGLLGQSQRRQRLLHLKMTQMKARRPRPCVPRCRTSG